jgi:hypothetical protein
MRRKGQMPRLQDEQTRALLEGKRILDPLNKRKKYTTSRLVVQPDGTTVPVLRLIALEKFGPWKEVEYEPIWTDGDWTNETWTNVSLLERLAEVRDRRSTYGVPAGTPEYYRRYRKANRDKVAAAQKRYNARKRDALRAAKAVVEGQETAIAAAGPSALEAEGQDLLNELMNHEKTS